MGLRRGCGTLQRKLQRPPSIFDIVQSTGILFGSLIMDCNLISASYARVPKKRDIRPEREVTSNLEGVLGLFLLTYYS